ncbi:Protein Y71G12A.2 b [Aphelenchoides avenae]|nr:Protein Y71G12A.2 b [Aphelenchus avenae]
MKCVVSIVYKRLKRTTALAANPSFVCSANSENVPCLSRVSKGMHLRSAEIVDNLRAAVEACNDDCLVFTNDVLDNDLILQPADNVLVVRAKPESLGCYYLHHVKVETPLSEFYLHYATEMLHQRGLEMAFCQVGVTKPKVTLCDDDTLYAGVPQRLRLKLVSGTIAIPGGSTLRIRQNGESAIELLCPDKEWRPQAEYPVPYLEADETFHLELVACLSIDRLNYSADQSLLLHHALEVEWLDEKWTFSLKSTSIMSIKTVLHHITDKVLFEADIQRCDDQRDLVVHPLEAKTYQQQDVAMEPVEATLLNPTLEDVVASSSYRLVWQLPENTISKTVPVSHRFLLKYRVDLSGNYAEAFPSLAVREKVYAFEDELVFAVDKVEYEICSQILSERPQTVLCRAESQCDLIVSLRSLLSQVEAIVVALDVDPTHWAVLERFKVIQIKESGLGQATFGIIPKKVGFMPYPHIKIHRCNFDVNAIDQVPEATLFGERLTSYNRNEGKQVHVLGPVVHSEDSLSGNSSTASGKKSLRTQAKQRLQKLFEPKQSDRLSAQL